MSLWVVFPPLALALFGTVVWLSAVATACSNWIGRREPFVSEATAWWRLHWPLLAGAIIVSFLCGWALQEPDPADEWIGPEMWLLAGLTGVVVVRALLRAARSLLDARRASFPIATVGLLRCRTIVSEAFERAASEETLSAALAHEAAHVRARDPIRIWLAQLASDLQWPIPRARRLYRSWALALEMLRDDEAVSRGAAPTALAEGILLAARLHLGVESGASACITGDGGGLAVRVHRLISIEADGSGPRASRRCSWIRLLCCAALVLAAVLGITYGESLLVLLPGVGR